MFCAGYAVSLPYGTTNLTNLVSVGTDYPERDLTNNTASDTNQVTAYPDLNLEQNRPGSHAPVSQSAPSPLCSSGSNAGYAIATAS